MCSAGNIERCYFRTFCVDNEVRIGSGFQIASIEMPLVGPKVRVRSLFSQVGNGPQNPH